MKRLTLEEIIALPKASVIWREEHGQDHESDMNYYEVIPMLICVPGLGGVLAWADHDSELALDIDEKLITENRIFWDEEPAADQLKEGVPIQELNRFFEEIDVREIRRKKLLGLISYYRYSVPGFCKAARISESRFMEILKGDPIEVSEVWQIGKTLNMSIDDLYEHLRRTGSKVIPLSEYMKGGIANV